LKQNSAQRGEKMPKLSMATLSGNQPTTNFMMTWTTRLIETEFPLKEEKNAKTVHKLA